MLPEALLCLLSVALSRAQTTLPLNAITSLNTARLPNPPTFSLPRAERLAISVALCSSSSSFPRFFLSNDSSATLGDPGLTQLPLESGQGVWTDSFAAGGIFAIDFTGSESIAFDIGVSSTEPLHETLGPPFFGDTSSNGAIIFSPPFAELSLPKPSYPNYTLPAANMPRPNPPINTPNFTLILSPTSSNLASEPNTGCFLSNQSSTGIVINETVWARDEAGFRNEWLMAGLTPSTNYTAFVLQDTTKVSGPIYFSTKSAAFPCSLAHSLPYCPSVAYSVPLPQLPGALAYNESTIPNAVSETFLSYMSNFTVSLTSFACGRDWYSPLVGCDDCQREYRKWLCSITFTRCSEPSPQNPDGFTAIPAQPSATGLAASKQSGSGSAQQVLSALLPQQTESDRRNPTLPALDSDYLVLLPCLEQCNKVDRSCPPFLGYKCPTKRFNAAASYGVGYIDGANGQMGGGLTGVAQDRWGNVWCNML